MRSNPCLPLLAAVSLLLSSPLVSAAAQRTFVASYSVPGNTAFNCSITKPCRAFSDAIGVTSAGGEVIVLDSAGYGPVTITQSVSLIAPAGVYAGITAFSGDGTTVNAPGAEMIMLDTIVRDNGGTGIGIAADASVVIDRVRSEHNGFDGFYIQSVSAEARASITDGIFAFNGVNGVSVTTSSPAGTTFAQVERSALADNGAAGFKIDTVAGSYAAAALTRNAIHRNTGVGVALAGPGNTRATVSENAILHNNNFGISADGSQTFVSASANSLAAPSAHNFLDFAQFNGATFYSFGNNAGVFGTLGSFSTFALF